MQSVFSYGFFNDAFLSQTKARRAVNNELKRMCKETVLARSEMDYRGVCLEGSRKTMKVFSQDERFLVRD
jgi:hypothetical protein